MDGVTKDGHTGQYSEFDGIISRYFDCSATAEELARLESATTALIG